MEEIVRYAREGKGREAFEALARLKWELMHDEDVYREPLVLALDRAFKAAWKIWQAGERGEKPKQAWVDAVEREVNRIAELIENPRGEKANPPTRVKSARDCFLWMRAQMMVLDEYPDVEEGSERFWRLVSGLFTRLKGGKKKDIRKAFFRLVLKCLGRR